MKSWVDLALGQLYFANVNAQLCHANAICIIDWQFIMFPNFIQMTKLDATILYTEEVLVF